MIYVLTIWLMTIEFDTLALCAAVRADLIEVYEEKWGTDAIGTCERVWK